MTEPHWSPQSGKYILANRQPLQSSNADHTTGLSIYPLMLINKVAVDLLDAEPWHLCPDVAP